jgi:L-iditol 2-dehydrogenase
MYAPAGVNIDPKYPVPEKMRAWVLGEPGQLTLKEKPVPVPKKAEVLVRIDAVAICATDLECARPQGTLKGIASSEC